MNEHKRKLDSQWVTAMNTQSSWMKCHAKIIKTPLEIDESNSILCPDEKQQCIGTLHFSSVCTAFWFIFFLHYTIWFLCLLITYLSEYINLCSKIHRMSCIMYKNAEITQSCIFVRLIEKSIEKKPNFNRIIYIKYLFRKNETNTSFYFFLL